MRYPQRFYYLLETHANAMTNMIFHDTIQRGLDPNITLPAVMPKFAYDYQLATGQIIDTAA